MRVKRLRNVKYLFYKNNAEKNGAFHMQIMVKGGNKHTRIICYTCSKLSMRAQIRGHISLSRIKSTDVWKMWFIK